MANTYLETLELQPGATKSEIKTAYRRLSKKYHPDINNSPDAQEQFVAINEAYRFLTDVGPKPHQEPVAYDYDPYHREYEERRRRARTYAFKQAREAQRRQEASIIYALGLFDSLAYIILVFNTMISIDYFLPVSVHNEHVRTVEKIKEGRRAGVANYRYDDVVFENFKLRINKGELIGSINPKAIVYTTPALKIARYADLIVDGHVIRIFQIYGIYAVFGFLIPGIFIVAVLYRFVMNSLDHKFTLAIVMTGIFAFQLYMFFKFY